MFQFPGFAPDGLCIQPPVTPSGCPVTPGCPIRKSPDQSLFDGSPEHIAAYHVLHRLCTPRHPPYTLSSLITFMKHCDQPEPDQSSSIFRFERERSRTFNRMTRKSNSCGWTPRVHPMKLSKSRPESRDWKLETRNRRNPYGHPTANRPPTLGLRSQAISRHRRASMHPICRMHSSSTMTLAASALQPLDWSRPGSNRQPPRCKRGALPIELRPR